MEKSAIAALIQGCDHVLLTESKFLHILPIIYLLISNTYLFKKLVKIISVIAWSADLKQSFTYLA